jgi:hypothetical protein
MTSKQRTALLSSAEDTLRDLDGVRGELSKEQAILYRSCLAILAEREREDTGDVVAVVDEVEINAPTEPPAPPSRLGMLPRAPAADIIP